MNWSDFTLFEYVRFVVITITPLVASISLGLVFLRWIGHFEEPVTRQLVVTAVISNVLFWILFLTHL